MHSSAASLAKRAIIKFIHIQPKRLEDDKIYISLKLNTDIPGMPDEVAINSTTNEFYCGASTC